MTALPVVGAVTTNEQRVLAIAKHIEGWKSATFGFQGDPDPLVADQNLELAVQAHAAECLRRIRAVLDEQGTPS